METTNDEVVQIFSAAKNVNAALKHLLKNEAAQNDHLARFAKNFRSAVSGFSSAQATKLFIQNNYKGNEVYFLIAARYAHADLLDPLLDQIVTTYGEEFNATYENGENNIEVKDRATFNRIVKDVSEKIDASLKTSSIPASGFMKQVAYHSLFEPNVLKEVSKLS